MLNKVLCALQDHNGFNLIVGDIATKELAYLTNRGTGKKGPTPLHAGLHGISNGGLSDRWVKVDRGMRLLQVRTQLTDCSNLGTRHAPYIATYVGGDRWWDRFGAFSAMRTLLLDVRNSHCTVAAMFLGVKGKGREQMWISQVSIGCYLGCLL